MHDVGHHWGYRAKHTACVRCGASPCCNCSSYVTWLSFSARWSATCCATHPQPPARLRRSHDDAGMQMYPQRKLSTLPFAALIFWTVLRTRSSLNDFSPTCQVRAQDASSITGGSHTPSYDMAASRPWAATGEWQCNIACCLRLCTGRQPWNPSAIQLPASHMHIHTLGPHQELDQACTFHKSGCFSSPTYQELDQPRLIWV
jgi:hypothetical protein